MPQAPRVPPGHEPRSYPTAVSPQSACSITHVLLSLRTHRRTLVLNGAASLGLSCRWLVWPEAAVLSRLPHEGKPQAQRRPQANLAPRPQSPHGGSQKWQRLLVHIRESCEARKWYDACASVCQTRR